MDKSNDDTLLAEWLAGTISEADLRILAARVDLDALSKKLALVDEFTVPDYNDADLWKKIIAKKENQSQRTVRQLLRPLLAIAAAIFGFMMIWFFWSGQDTVKLVTKTGEKIEFMLPDSSTIYLNAGTKASYQANTYMSDRTIYLEGQGFFSVKKGKPFTVKTERGKIRVLGTTFDINTRGHEIFVACYSGKVAVEKNKKEVTLTADEIALDKNGSLEKITVPSTDKPTWIEGLSRFEKVPLNFVFEELERQYSVKVQYKKDLSGRAYSGIFPHDNLEDALKLVCGAMNLDYTRKKNIITVK